MKTKTAEEILNEFILGDRSRLLPPSIYEEDYAGGSSEYIGYDIFIRTIEEYGNQRFTEGKKEGISEAVDACTIMVIGSVCFIEEHESRIKIVMKKVKDELLSKL